MQEGAIDYYECEEETGCCLKCSKSYPGCLCYDCNCKDCYWYSSPYETGIGKGLCDLVPILKEQGRKDAIKRFRIQSKEKHEKIKKLQLLNKKIENGIKEEGEIPNIYSCQKCGFDFVTSEILKIVKSKTPICNVCNNKIILTEEEKKIIKQGVENEISSESEDIE